ncbi:MAG: hypothetical protein DPW16_00465 [Chloroflexi bacterium]|nr:hypothetical protein [Chloroflexota bacterium]
MRTSMKNIAIVLIIGFLSISGAVNSARSQVDKQSKYREVLHLGRGLIRDIAWSPDGRILAVGGSQGLWSYTPDFQDISHFNSEVRYVVSIAWSPDGKRIATSNTDSTTDIWEILTGQIITTFRTDAAFLAWGPDGTKLASAGHEVHIYDVENGDLLYTLEGHSLPLSGLSWSVDGKLAAASRSGKITLWDTNTGENLAQILASDEGEVYALTWSPDGAVLVGAISDIENTIVRQSLVFWDARTYEVITILDVIDGVYNIEWNSDGNQLAGSLSNGDVRIWNYPTNQPQGDLVSISASAVTSMAWQPNAKNLTIARLDNQLEIWDISSNEMIHQFDGHSSQVDQVAWSPNGEFLALSTRLGNLPLIKVLDASTGALVIAFRPEKAQNPVIGLEWSSDGRFLATASYFSETILVWSVEDLQASPILQLTHEGHVINFEWIPNEQKIVSVYIIGDATRVLVWDTAHGNPLTDLANKFANVSSLAWSPDGQMIATSLENGLVEIWDAQSYQPLLPLEDESQRDLLAWSPDSKFLAGFKCRSQFSDCALRIWATDTGQLLGTSATGVDYPISVAWSPDGKFIADGGDLAIGGNNGGLNPDAVHIWDADTGELLTTINFTDDVTRVSWSPEGSYLAASSWDGSVRVWQLGEIPPATLPTPAPNQR